MGSDVRPFLQRKLDWVFVAFFLVNLCFVTYIVDIEQLIIPNPYHYQQPPWPPAAMVNLIHSYGQTYDPLVMARPQWWKMTIWLDVLFYGPFYVFAIYAFIKGRNWIRMPAIFYSGMMFADVFIILGEEAAGPHAAPDFPFVFMLNLPWLLVPIFLTLRLQKQHPFESRD
ncbi:MAG: emopamil-binding family protein [Anaerolineales bacterium]